jgi:hypothetical protein
VALSAVFLVALGALVIYGMVLGADPNFDRGRSPMSSVVAQETIGLLTLIAVGATGLELAAVAGGKTASRLPPLLIATVLLAIVWWVAFAFERAS